MCIRDRSKAYARGGAVATSTVVLNAGEQALAQFAGSMEPQFRALGLPTRLVDEKIMLEHDVELAKIGEQLTVENAKILRLLGYKLGDFWIQIIAGWDKSGAYKNYI
eukprot:TRINITY_DN0_c945_g1_i2.p1 TRINITY_DN0_c945_g1~~TRINITY_DN0_c945_g1_i2.p1  ORF type:complete len:107 (+),score=16.07 TRINITY_DN0_c945_g1_i2:1-321(+)